MRGNIWVRGKLNCAVAGVILAFAQQCAVWAQAPVSTQPSEAVKGASHPSVKVPLSIIENQGQTDFRVKFYLAGGRGAVFFAQDEVVFKLVGENKDSKDNKDGKDFGERVLEAEQGVVIRLSFPGANPLARLEGLEPLPGRINDIRGNDPAKWRKDIRTFGGVVYRDLYPGIDLEYRTGTGELQRALVIRDRAHLGEFQFRYAGTEALRLTGKGVLELVTALGTIREAPMATVEPDKRLPDVALKYAVLSKDTVGLRQ